MRNADQLRDLLRPLGVYDLGAPMNGSALEAEGGALDQLEGWLEELERECSLIAAEDWGLEQWCELMQLRPAARDTAQLRKSVQALLRIGTQPCTLRAINDTLEGCGIPALVSETGTGTVEVRFPGTPGEPEDFEALKKNIEEILPVHLGITYLLRWFTWELLESRGWTWEDLAQMSWEEMQKAV